MPNTVFEGSGDDLVAVSTRKWEEELAGTPSEMRRVLAFMSGDHHRVRNFVVTHMVRTMAPVPASTVARTLALRPERVDEILEDLERNLFFLVRKRQKQVSWAFPVTVEPTPHRLTFDTGERLWAA